jgi:hypothetical protein
MTLKSIAPAMFSALVLFCSSLAHGDDTSWGTAAKKRGLSTKERAQLEKNGFLITNDSDKQIYSAYDRARPPIFITSDSLLNAYHVLYEDSISQLETTRASQLAPLLRLLVENLENTESNSALGTSAKKRAMLVTGIALKLLDDSFSFNHEELDQILTQEVARIEAANVTLMPSWLGTPTASFTALDYTKYKPRSFYTGSEDLERYFRAVSWLQSIPFRVSNEEELLSILMLGGCITHSSLDDYEKEEEIELFFQTYSSLIGAKDDWDLIAAAQWAEIYRRVSTDNESLLRLQASLITKASNNDEAPQINDLVRMNDVQEPSFRIFSANRTPDAMLFQQTMETAKPNRLYPDGLEVAAALGSKFARQELSNRDQEDTLQIIDLCRSEFKGDTLYSQYMFALQALLDAPEPDAPDFMKNDAWDIKSCNTVLAGWAQLKHTWALHSKEYCVYGSCRIDIPRGFVEPNPEFFSRLADLSLQTKTLLLRTGTLQPDPNARFSLEKSWELLEKTSRRLEIISHKQLRQVDLNERETAFMDNYGGILEVIMQALGSTKDDAPRIVDVFTNQRRQAHLHVGIARPRKMYVLYPWENEDVLCEGAVLPYYEFTHTSRLTDTAWKEMLDSEKRPSIPEWVSPIINKGRLSQPDLPEY